MLDHYAASVARSVCIVLNTCLLCRRSWAELRSTLFPFHWTRKRRRRRQRSRSRRAVLPSSSATCRSCSPPQRFLSRSPPVNVLSR